MDKNQKEIKNDDKNADNSKDIKNSKINQQSPSDIKSDNKKSDDKKSPSNTKKQLRLKFLEAFSIYVERFFYVDMKQHASQSLESDQ